MNVSQQFDFFFLRIFREFSETLNKLRRFVNSSTRIQTHGSELLRDQLTNNMTNFIKKKKILFTLMKTQCQKSHTEKIYCSQKKKNVTNTM